jgi:hypothetical protein
MNMTKELSESLLAACKAAGIEKPRYIAQDKDEPYVWHYDLKPDTDDTKELDMWAVDNGNATKIHHPPYAEDWKDSLLEWVDQEKAYCELGHGWLNVDGLCTACKRNQGESLTQIVVGKRYVMRNGHITFVIKENTGRLPEHFPYSDGVYSWTNNGTVYMGANIKSEYDIVSEYKQQGEPLSDVLARHPDHVADDTEMVILYNLADTSKKVDDAIRIGYHKHVVNGDGLCWSRAGDYRKGWQDALA